MKTLVALILASASAFATTDTACFMTETQTDGRYNYVEVRTSLIEERGLSMLPGSNPVEIDCGQIWDEDMDGDVAMRIRTTSGDPDN